MEQMLKTPKEAKANVFLKNEATAGLKELEKELVSLGLDAVVSSDSDSIRLSVRKGESDDFVFGIKLVEYSTSEYMDTDSSKYYRAEVFLLSGGQNYDVYGFNKDQIIADAVTQYEKHIQFIHNVEKDT